MGPPADGGDDERFDAARERLTDRLAAREDVDEKTLAAIRSVPRHEFVPEERRHCAYRDEPLPIGEGQTISAPHAVAMMTSLLDVEAGDDVLEVGTGCGYHAAVTSRVVAPGSVYTVEYERSLAAEARERLDALGYDNVACRVGDGREGWPEHAPYDAAYLTCAPPDVPDAVREQVRTGGRVVAPVGRRRQRLVRLTLRDDGVEREDHGGVRFVPMQ